ncbi:hypothetical protein QTP88_008826 [Uroleucon formosanum]
MLCLVCNDEIKCKNCKDYLHFSCASFRETAFRKLTHEAKLKFSCAKCKVNMGLNSNTKSKNEDVFVGSNETLSDLTNSVKFMSATFDDFSKQLKEVLHNIKELKEENNVLKENNIKLNSDIYKLFKRLNLLEQKSILNHVEIIGVPDLKNENCEKVVENIAAVMGQPVTVIKAYSIRSKIPNKPMKIIAELSSTHHKKTLMESAKKKKVKACNINESWGNGECLLKKITLSLSVYCIYRSPSGDKNKFLTIINSILSKNECINGHVIIIGDINLNIIGSDCDENEYLDIISEKGFRSLINVYTRTPIGQRHSCLDHIFIKSGNALNSKIEAGVIQTNITDHFSTVLAIEINKEKSVLNCNVKTINYNDLENLFKNECWADIFNCNDVNSCMDIFLDKINTFVKMSTTKKVFNSKNNRIREWMTAGLLYSVHFKRKLSLKVRKYSNNVRLAILACNIEESTFKFEENITPISFNSTFDENIKESDVRVMINKLKDDTAVGFDGISKLKLAIIKPIYKNGDKTCINNYRPISMLSNFSKILEKIVKNRLITFLEKHELLSKQQFGFRPGLGTENALYSATHFIKNALDNSKKVIAIFLDLSKAFDTVNHKKLINILPNFGITVTSLIWFTSYLENRKQTVCINGITGDDLFINCGVPQGSVLGPLLFILYINHVCNLDIDGRIVTYADDTCLLYCGDSWSDVSTKATRESKIVVEFLKLRSLSINFKKTMFMNFSINDVEDNFDELTLHFCENGTLCNGTVCQKLFRVSSTRYLGLTFYKLRKILSVHVMRTVYLALYQAIFQYGLLIWGELSDNALKPLLLHQRQIVRVCLQKTNYVGSTGLNFKEFSLLPVDFVFKKMAIMWVIKHLDQWVEKNEISNKRAFRSFDAKTSLCKKSVGQKFVDYLGPIPNAREATAMYSRQYPDRYHPHYTYVQKLEKSLKENGSFNRTNAVQQQPRANPNLNEDIENQVLAYVHLNPRSSIRHVGREVGVSKTLVHKILKKYKLHPYKPDFVQHCLQGHLTLHR